MNYNLSVMIALPGSTAKTGETSLVFPNLGPGANF